MGREEGTRGAGRALSPWVRIGLGEGAAPPFPSLLPLPSFFPLPPSGILLGLGGLVGLLSWHALQGPAGLPPPPLYTEAGGGDLEHNKINCLSRVRCPPPEFTTSVISSYFLGEALRL